MKSLRIAPWKVKPVKKTAKPAPRPELMVVEMDTSLDYHERLESFRTSLYAVFPELRVYEPVKLHQAMALAAKLRLYKTWTYDVVRKGTKVTAKIFIKY